MNKFNIDPYGLQNTTGITGYSPEDLKAKEQALQENWTNQELAIMAMMAKDDAMEASDYGGEDGTNLPDWTQYLPQDLQERYHRSPQDFELQEPEPQRGMLSDIYVGASAGFGNAVEQGAQTLYEGANFFDDMLGLDWLENDRERVLKLNRYDVHAQTSIGKITEGISQFVTGFVSGGALLKGIGAVTNAGALATKLPTAVQALGKTKKAKYLGSSLKGAMVDWTFFDPYEERLSNIIQETGLANPITEFLSADENDSKATARLKNTLEGMGLGVITDGFFASIKGMRALKNAKAKDLPLEQVQEIVDDIAEETKRAVPKHMRSQAVDVVNGVEIPETVNGIIESIKTQTDEPIKKIIDDVTGFIADDNAQPKTKTLQALITDLSKTSNMEVDKKAVREVLQDVQSRLGGSPEDYRVRDSLINTKGLPKEAQHMTDVLRERFGTEVNGRDFDQVTHIPWKRRVQEAVDFIGDDNMSKEDMKNLLKEMGDIGDALTTMVVLSRRTVAEEAQRFKPLLNRINSITDPTELAQYVDTEVTAVLNDYLETVSHADRFSSGVGEALNAHKAKPDTLLKNSKEELVSKVKKVHGKETAQAVSDEKFEKVAKVIEGRTKQPSETLEQTKQTLNNMSHSEKIGLIQRYTIINDPDKARRGMSLDSRTGKLLMMSNEYWINALLSSPKTHIVNIASSLMKVGATMPLERMLGSKIGKYRGHFGDNAQAIIQEREMWNEGAQALNGLMFSIGDAWQMAKKSFETDQNLLKPFNSLIEDSRRSIKASNLGLSNLDPIGKMINTLGDVVNLPTRFLMAGDEFVSQLAYRQNVYTKLFTKAENMLEAGTLTLTNGQSKSEFITDFIEKNFDSYFRDTKNGDNFVQKLGTGFKKSQSMRYAEEATFSADLDKGTIGAKIQGMAQDHPMVRRFVAPFVRTPLNIIYDVVDHTPLIVQMSKKYQTAWGADKALAEAKVTLGSFMWLSAITLGMSGKLTGNGPANPTQRAALMETGWRPNSIKIDHGDGKATYIDYSSMEPMASILSMAGDYVDIANSEEMQTPEGEKELGKIASALVFSTIRTLGSKTFLRTASETLAVLSSGNMDDVNKFLKNQTLSYIPAIAGQTKKALDPTIREAQGLLEEAKSRIPGLSSTLAQKYSWLTGEPLVATGGRMSTILPVSWTTTENNPIAEELLKFSRTMNAPSSEIAGVKLNSQQRSDYYRLHGTVTINGKTLVQALEELFNSPEYDMERKVEPDTRDPALNPRARKISSIIADYRQQARKEVMVLHPDIRDSALAGSKQSQMFKLAGRALQEKQARQFEETKETKGVQKLYNDLYNF